MLNILMSLFTNLHPFEHGLFLLIPFNILLLQQERGEFPAQAEDSGKSFEGASQMGHLLKDSMYDIFTYSIYIGVV